MKYSTRLIKNYPKKKKTYAKMYISELFALSMSLDGWISALCRSDISDKYLSKWINKAKKQQDRIAQIILAKKGGA